MKKREANFTTKFERWVKATKPFTTTTWWEVKQTTGTSISFAAFKEHQLDWLTACRHGQTSYKIPDDSRGVKPVDGVTTVYSGAVVVLKFPKEFHIIPIDTWLLEVKRSKRKSITSTHARELSTVSVKC